MAYQSQPYYFKVLIVYDNHAPAHQILLKTTAKNEDQAEAFIDTRIESWDNIQCYWVRRISLVPIRLQSYLLTVSVRYTTKTKEIKFRLSLENKEEANEVFHCIIETWKNVKGFRVLSVTPLHSHRVAQPRKQY